MVYSKWEPSKLKIKSSSLSDLGGITGIDQHKLHCVGCWGQGKIRPLWRHHFQNTQGLIIVIDSNDRDNIVKARKIRDFSKIQKSILSVLIAAGMTPSLPQLVKAGPTEVLHVLLDGRVGGVIPTDRIKKTVNHLRKLKLSAASMIPEDLEGGYVPISMGGAFPSLYLFTNPSRFIRPVRRKFPPPEENNNIEPIRPFERTLALFKKRGL